MIPFCAFKYCLRCFDTVNESTIPDQSPLIGMKTGYCGLTLSTFEIKNCEVNMM